MIHFANDDALFTRIVVYGCRCNLFMSVSKYSWIRAWFYEDL